MTANLGSELQNTRIEKSIGNSSSFTPINPQNLEMQLKARQRVEKFVVQVCKENWITKSDEINRVRGTVTTLLDSALTGNTDSTSTVIGRLHLIESFEKVNTMHTQEPLLTSEKDNEKSQSNPRFKTVAKLQSYVDEINVYGGNAVDAYYTAIENIEKSTSCSDVDSTTHTASQKLRTSELTPEKRSTLEIKLFQVARKKRTLIKGYNEDSLDPKTLKSKMKDSRMGAFDFFLHWGDVWKAFQEATPDDQKAWILHRAPKPVIDFLVGLKQAGASVSSEMVAADIIARYGWQLRVGRVEELKKVFTETFGSVIKTPNFERFVNRVYDEYLQTEASGFEIKENIRVKENVNTQALLRESMNALLRTHRPRGQNHVYFTVFYGENQMQKVSIDVHDNITSDELDRNIAAGLDVSHISSIPLTGEERANLGYKRYSLKRNEDEAYKKLYRFGANNDIKGDYIIQIKNHSNASAFSNDNVNEHNPDTVFATDDAQMALLIDARNRLQNKAHAIKTVLRYNHSKIDGVPAFAHSQKIIKALQETKVSRFSSLTQEQYKDLDSRAESIIEDRFEGAPSLEGRSVFKEQNEQYPSIRIPYTNKKGETSDVKLSPAFTRSFIYALANDVDIFHYLHAANKSSDLFFDEMGDRFDSLQPIYTSFNHLKDEFTKWKASRLVNQEQVKEWMNMYVGQKNRAESKYCDVFTFASAPPGKLEVPFSKLSGLFHGGAKMLTAPAGGMYSGLPPQLESDAHATSELSEKNIFDTEFSTAQASLYNNIPIDLVNSRPSMGVVGYLQRGEVAVSTCRKLPCQAQDTFKKELVKLVPELSEKGQQDRFLKHFNPLLKKWDGLLKGTNSLTEYTDERKKLFDRIVSGSILGFDSLVRLNINNTVLFQKYLDGILQKSAEDTLNSIKINETKNSFMEFLQASGVNVSVKTSKIT